MVVARCVYTYHFVLLNYAYFESMKGHGSYSEVCDDAEKRRRSQRAADCARTLRPTHAPPPF